MFGLVHLSHPGLGGSPWSGSWNDPHGSLPDASDTIVLVGLSLTQKVDQQEKWKINIFNLFLWSQCKVRQQFRMFNTIIKDCRQFSKETINLEVSTVLSTAANQFMRPCENYNGHPVECKL